MEIEFPTSVAFLLFHRGSYLAVLGSNFAKLGNGRS